MKPNREGVDQPDGTHGLSVSDLREPEPPEEPGVDLGKLLNEAGEYGVLTIDGDAVTELTERRLDLVRYLQNNEVSSVSELARETGYDRKNVTEDLDVLSELGLVRDRREGKRRVPFVPYDQVVARVA